MPDLYHGCPVSILDTNGNIKDLGWVEEEKYLQDWTRSSHVWVRFMGSGEVKLISVRYVVCSEITPDA